MQDRPSKEVLLDALSSFLINQARPAIADPGLSFRTLIAANLAMVVANEIRSEETQNAAELARLRDLLPEVQVNLDGTRDNLRDTLQALNQGLARKLRNGAFDAAGLRRAQDHVKETLLEKLSVNNPRFETDLDIERSS